MTKIIEIKIHFFRIIKNHLHVPLYDIYDIYDIYA